MSEDFSEGQMNLLRMEKQTLQELKKRQQMEIRKILVQEIKNEMARQKNDQKLMMAAQKEEDKKAMRMERRRREELKKVEKQRKRVQMKLDAEAEAQAQTTTAAAMRRRRRLHWRKCAAGMRSSVGNTPRIVDMHKRPKLAALSVRHVAMLSRLARARRETRAAKGRTAQLQQTARTRPRRTPPPGHLPRPASLGPHLGPCLGILPRPVSSAAASAMSSAALLAVARAVRPATSKRVPCALSHVTRDVCGLSHRRLSCSATSEMRRARLGSSRSASRSSWRLRARETS